MRGWWTTNRYTVVSRTLAYPFYVEGLIAEAEVLVESCVGKPMCESRRMKRITGLAGD